MTNPADRLAYYRLLLAAALTAGARDPFPCPDCANAFRVRSDVAAGVEVETEVHDDGCPQMAGVTR